MTPRATVARGALLALGFGLCFAFGFATATLHDRDAPRPAARCVARAGGALPDPRCTPGATDHDVTRSMLCDGRHPTLQRRDVPATVRDRVLRDYAYDARSFEGEVDHLIPLELGGNNEPGNLWPQPGRVPNPKDAVENRLRRDVCAGRRSLGDTQRMIAVDWRAA